MKALLKSLFLITVIAALTSCEDVVQIKLDEGSKLYVIDAFVNNLPEKQVIKVSTNDQYFSNSSAPPLSGAQVILKDLTAGKQFLFAEENKGEYVYVPSGDTLSRVDHQYELNVTIDGVTYTSLATQKRTAVIDTIESVLFDGSGGFGPPPAKPFYLCNLLAFDPAGLVPDYYWVKTFRNDSLLFGPSDINIAIDGTNGAVGDLGVEYTAFTPPITFLGFNQYYSGNTCKVEIHSLSRESYYFFIQASTQINNGGLFATTPENVKTNILTPENAATKAVGWFNMATVTSLKITIP